MKLYAARFFGNPYLGLYAKASDKIALAPVGSNQKFLQSLTSLGVPIICASIDSSPYLGVYAAMNSHGIILPPFVSANELSIFKKSGLEIFILPDGRFSAIGNNIACNDHGALVHPELPPKFAKQIEKTLNVPVQQGSICGCKTVGMAVAPTNAGYVANNRINDEEAEFLFSVFGVRGINCTVNGGAAMVGLGIVANSNGALVGGASTGFEIGRIQQGLNLI